ncbi:unnamed protein product [Rotaria sordida]|uniref:Uncharacterized protein n=2 Tax=Rotaria sordida TaxID=392033 RepID=A0A814J2Z0_9BILA|nr:unnamed protein product [Rotaria sordida]CAF1026204.1 unnamed protein product [Rotaria sordida]CAF1032626.1 unnamed protein product [Rotaria sordida]CAF1054033.1 unnamed protein product [Rotaria sordida]CAF3645450.1 unnamed protein product [Rotaria sordida]
MNLSNILDNNNNNNTFSITTLQSIRKSYVENPFNSWYIGGILFLCSFLLILVGANYYHKNYCQLCLKYLTPNHQITQTPPSSSTHSFVNRVVDPVLV